MVRTYNYASSEWVDIDHGFLIVEAFAHLYEKYKNRYDLHSDVYAIPRIDRKPEDYLIQYKGLDRDALKDYANSEIEAELSLALLEIDNRAVDGIVFAQSDVEEIYASLGASQAEYEIIWTRIAGCEVESPDDYVSAGFEPTYFTGDHFSALCDCMIFPRWHGTDEEGKLFMPYFRQLNQYGLFPTADAANEFTVYYLSFDWTEHDEYEIAEVFIKQ